MRWPPGVSAVPEVPTGQLSSSFSRVPMFVFTSSSVFMGHGWPCSSPTDCATETLSHMIIIITITTKIPPHRKEYCTLNKHFSLLMITGCTMAQCSRVQVSVYMDVRRLLGMLLRLIPKWYSLIPSVDVWRSVESQLLQDHGEAGGGGAGVPDGGGAHLQPFLRAAGEVCGLLRGREAGVSSHHNLKRHHAGERDTVESHFKGGSGRDPLLDLAQTCSHVRTDHRAALQPKKLSRSLLCLLLANQTGKKSTFPAPVWLICRRYRSLMIYICFTFQLLKIRPSQPDKEYVHMTFVEHQTCECR